jgi:hypothetical protein
MEIGLLFRGKGTDREFEKINVRNIFGSKKVSKLKRALVT